MTPQIPVIDFKPWVGIATREDRLKVAIELIEGCHNTGFVYITNHGISPELLSEAFVWNKKFFDLDEEKKAQAAHPPDSMIFRGYSKIGLEMIPPREEEKVEGVLDFNESYGMGSDNNEEQPNVWIPESILPGFQEFVKIFYAGCWKTSQLVLRALSLGLGLQDENYLLKFHGEKENQVSFRHYPPVSEAKVRSGEMDRLGAHTDFDSFTLLWQDENGGLTVKIPSTGKWVDVLPIEGALVMNIGDVLTRWSDDYLVSTVHRVHLPPLEQSYTGKSGNRMTKNRFSIPYFVPPKLDTLMVPLEGSFAKAEESKYKPILFSDLAKQQTEGYFEGGKEREG